MDATCFFLRRPDSPLLSLKRDILPLPCSFVHPGAASFFGTYMLIELAFANKIGLYSYYWKKKIKKKEMYKKLVNVCQLTRIRTSFLQ